MRASRLLTILMELQARRRATAPDLARICEVSVRTIYRDIDALSAAGVPVYADRGAAGGYRLIDGYRTRLNGISDSEAASLFLAGLPRAAEALGLGAALATTQSKLMVALPESVKEAALRLRSRFHYDAPAWFHDAAAPPHLHAVFDALWADRLIDIRYRSWRGERRRRLAPLGLVLKAGQWYLVGQVGDDLRTYSVIRILEFAPTDARFERPAGFDLARHWEESTRHVEEELHRGRATVRFTALGRRMIPALLTPYARANLKWIDDDGGNGDAGGSAILPVETPHRAVATLLAFGAEAEVVAPDELRTQLVDTVRSLAAIYDIGEFGSPSAPRDGSDEVPRSKIAIYENQSAQG